MKVLKVISVSNDHEFDMDHPIYSGAPEADLIVATLQGIMRAGHAVKSFELVEADNG